MSEERGFNVIYTMANSGEAAFLSCYESAIPQVGQRVWYQDYANHSGLMSYRVVDVQHSYSRYVIGQPVKYRAEVMVEMWGEDEKDGQK